MKKTFSAAVLGLLLIAAGVLFLLQNFGVFGNFEEVVWAILFGVGGLAFLAVFATNTEHWWAIIPGFTLLGLAALIGLGDRLGALGGALFLGAIGLSFVVIYILHRDFWWAIIPGGTLLTLALVAALADSIGEASGSIFFLGLAATFGVVYLLPTSEGRMKWAIFPAAALALMALVVLAATGNWFNVIWPVALILGGGFLVLRALLRK